MEAKLSSQKTPDFKLSAKPLAFVNFKAGLILTLLLCHIPDDCHIFSKKKHPQQPNIFKRMNSLQKSDVYVVANVQIQLMYTLAS